MEQRRLDGFYGPTAAEREADAAAEDFLREFYPEALRSPVAVPIEAIARGALGLSIRGDARLTPDGSRWGAIYFEDRVVATYGEFGELREMPVRAGTILIDERAYRARGEGAVRFTIAHEVGHWRFREAGPAESACCRTAGFAVGATRMPRDPANGPAVGPADGPADGILPANIPIIRKNAAAISTGRSQAPQGSQGPGRLHVPQAPGGLQPADESILHPITAATSTGRLHAPQGPQGPGRLHVPQAPQAPGGLQPADESILHLITAVTSTGRPHAPQGPQERRADRFAARVLMPEGPFRERAERWVREVGGGRSRLDSAARAVAEEALARRFRVSVAAARVRAAELRLWGVRESRGRPLERRLPRGRGADCAYREARGGPIALRGEELSVKRADFEDHFALKSALTKTFWERVGEIMRARAWNRATFCDRTLLHEVVYSRAITRHKSIPDVRTVVAICAGLDLDLAMTNELLALAGHALSNSKEHQALAYVIADYRGKPIEERNAFLESIGQRPLGSRQRK